MEIFTLLETLEDILENSKNLPFTNKGMVDKEEMLEIIKEIRIKLPDELHSQSYEPLIILVWVWLLEAYPLCVWLELAYPLWLWEYGANKLLNVVSPILTPFKLDILEEGSEAVANVSYPVMVSPAFATFVLSIAEPPDTVVDILKLPLASQVAEPVTFPVRDIVLLFLNLSAVVAFPRISPLIA